MLNNKYQLPAYYVKTGSLSKIHISAFQKAFLELRNQPWII